MLYLIFGIFAKRIKFSRGGLLEKNDPFFTNFQFKVPSNRRNTRECWFVVNRHSRGKTIQSWLKPLFEKWEHFL